MSLHDLILSPFLDYGFMRRALAACLALSLGGAPLGVFLVMRRMSLVGDAMSHAILPGAALAFLLFGGALWPLALGGLTAGLLVALAAGAVTRLTPLKEDASFTGMTLLSLALGVLLISRKGSSVDVMHLLFGNVLAVDNDSLLLVTGIASFSLLALAAVYRGLILECFDPVFLRTVSGRGAWAHQLFLMLLVLNLVSGFQALGTLMALGLLVLPAIAARFWMRGIDGMILFSIGGAMFSSVAGLLLSYHLRLPSGPTIVLAAGALYLASLLAGRHGSILASFFPRKHLTA